MHLKFNNELEDKVGRC